ncbi:splicing factor [Perkinsus olseni]|uniref:Splicing factor n=1 Tax=Perkinsus olseni TaxID=32597 RepID=A0A7J6P6I4_PEROL|nr:splicing factor [Perkinsus olseni]
MPTSPFPLVVRRPEAVVALVRGPIAEIIDGTRRGMSLRGAGLEMLLVVAVMVVVRGPREEGSYNEGESCSLIVRNLNYDTSPQHVRSLFSRYGEIRDVYLPLDYNTGRPRGFGFVEFCDHRDVLEAKNAMDGKVVDGNAILAEEAMAKAKVTTVVEEEDTDVAIITVEVMVAGTALEDVVMMITPEGEAIEMSMAEMTVEALEGVQGATAAIDVREVTRNLPVAVQTLRPVDVSVAVLEPLAEGVLPERPRPYDCNPMMLREAFEKYGEIRDVYIPLDYYSRRPRGFGFVEFSDPRDADEAKAAMDGKRIGGNAIEVEIAKERRKSPKTMRRMDDDYRGMCLPSGLDVGREVMVVAAGIAMTITEAVEADTGNVIIMVAAEAAEEAEVGVEAMIVTIGGDEKEDKEKASEGCSLEKGRVENPPEATFTTRLKSSQVEVSSSSLSPTAPPPNLLISGSHGDDRDPVVAADIREGMIKDSGGGLQRNGEAGSIGPEGKVYPGVMIPGGSNGGVPDSFPGALANTPHPAFRFARPVTDVHVRVLDVTHPDRAMIKWDAKFRLGPPLGEESAPAETPAEEGLGSGDGIEGGSNELPGDLKPIGGELPVFQKFCSKLNRPHMYKVTVNAGGGHPLDETLRMKVCYFGVDYDACGSIQAGIYRVIMLGPNPARLHARQQLCSCSTRPRMSPFTTRDEAMLISPEPLHRAVVTQSPPGTSYAQASSFAGKGEAYKGGHAVDAPSGGNCGCPGRFGVGDPPEMGSNFMPPTVTIQKLSHYNDFFYAVDPPAAETPCFHPPSVTIHKAEEYMGFL